MKVVPRCPTCNQRVGRSPLLVDIDNNVVARAGQVRRVNPKVAELLAILQDAYPAGVRSERMTDKLWGIRPPSNPQGCINQYVLRAREVLADIGGPWFIETCPGTYGISKAGYRLKRRVHACPTPQMSAGEARAA